jgi:hypothetical protein
MLPYVTEEFSEPIYLNHEDGSNMSFRNVRICLQEHSVTTQETEKLTRK